MDSGGSVHGGLLDQAANMKGVEGMGVQRV